MDRSHFLHVHIPGRGTVTLSLPGGLERALAAGRLPADAEAWHEGIRLWVSLARHPDVLASSVAQYLPAPVRLAAPVDMDEASDLDLFSLPHIPDILPEPEPALAVTAVDSEPEAAPADPDQLPLISLEDLEPHHEFSQFLLRSSATEERRKAVRTSGGVRPGGPAWVMVAGELRKGRRRLERLMQRYAVPGWAALLTIGLLGTTAIGLFFLGRATKVDVAASPVVTTYALSGNVILPDSVIAPVLAAPNPLAGEETELENNLRIAEAVVWQPPIDFASSEQIHRSSRKVDAVRNSISLYRVGAWRAIDSAFRDTDPRLEPYEESVRVDVVLNLVQSAVSVLDSLRPHFRVAGELLVFSDSSAAAPYLWIRRRADSLLQSPVENDSTHLARAPRRVVARLVETLPTAAVPSSPPPSP